MLKKGTHCLIKKTPRCVADRMSKTTTFFIFHFLQNAKILQENHVHIVGIGVSTSPFKNTPLFLAKPPLSQQTVQASLFRQFPYILVFVLYLHFLYTKEDRLRQIKKRRNTNDRTIILLTSLLITLT